MWHRAAGPAGGEGGLVKKKTKAPQGELTRRDRLREEIAAALEGIDEEGLVFLLEQANVLLHNARVEELDQKRRSRKGAKRGEAEPEARGGPPVAVEESGDRKAFFVILGKERKVLSLEEMQQVVRICHDAASTAEAATRLYTVFARERRDILMDAGIGSARHPLLAALAETVKARYRPRGA
jgi:hypothetical protein